MSASFIKSRPWLLVVGYLCLQSVAVRAQNTSPVPPPGSPKEFRTLKEFKDMIASYFAPGTFKKPDGSTDDNRAEVLAIYLREIGEPPLLRSDNNLEPHAYRLHWTGFPAGKTLVVRLQIDSLGSAKVFAKSTPFNGTNLLLNKEEGVTVEGVDRFLECVERADFWHLPTVEQPEPQMPDGSYWYLEGSRHGEYHIVYRRNPELHPNPFTDIGRYLAKDLAQLPDSIISIPRADRSEPARRVAHP